MTDADPIAIAGHAGSRNRMYHHASHGTYSRYEIQTTTAKMASSARPRRASIVGHRRRHGTKRVARPATARGVSIVANHSPYRPMFGATYDHEYASERSP